MQVSTKHLSAVVDITATEDTDINRAGTFSHTASWSNHSEANGTHIAKGS